MSLPVTSVKKFKTHINIIEYIIHPFVLELALATIIVSEFHHCPPGRCDGPAVHIYLYIYLSIYLYIYLSIYLSIYPTLTQDDPGDGPAVHGGHLECE